MSKTELAAKLPTAGPRTYWFQLGGFANAANLRSWEGEASSIQEAIELAEAEHPGFRVCNGHQR